MMTKHGKRSFSRLYMRISALFIVILFVFAAITLYISVQAANHYSQEVNQNMNHDLAAHVADMMKPFIRNGHIYMDGLSVMDLNANVSRASPKI